MHNVRSAVTVAAVAALTVAACGSSGGSTTTSPSSVAPESSSSSASRPSSSGSGAMSVDLEITGASNATIRGTKGTCTRSRSIGNSYSIEGADDPAALGANGAFSLRVGTRMGDRVEPPDIKLVIGSSGYLTGPDVAGIRSNPEGTVVNLNQGASGSTNGGPTQSVLIRGTIRCG